MDTRSIVTIYQITLTKAYSMYEQGTRYSLAPYANHNSQYYEGYDDGGQQYALPKGYQLTKGEGGSPRIIHEYTNVLGLATRGDSTELIVCWLKNREEIYIPLGELTQTTE